MPSQYPPDSYFGDRSRFFSSPSRFPDTPLVVRPPGQRRHLPRQVVLVGQPGVAFAPVKSGEHDFEHAAGLLQPFAHPWCSKELPPSQMWSIPRLVRPLQHNRITRHRRAQLPLASPNRSPTPSHCL